ncbi:MAG: DUF1989 domain-containing protein [Acidimicrobiales bacterium]
MTFSGAFRKYPVPGTVVAKWVIPARGYSAFLLRSGQVLRLVDLEGQQDVDIVFINQHNLEEHLNLGNSQQIAPGRRLRLAKGDLIVSQMCSPMMTIVDYSNEYNLSYSSMCSEATNRTRYGEAGTRNCRTNLASALAPWDFNEMRVPDAFKPFMKVDIDKEGNQIMTAPTTEPGDYYDLRCEMDLLVGVSACPQERNPTNGWTPTAIGIVIYESSRP